MKSFPLTTSSLSSLFASRGRIEGVKGSDANEQSEPESLTESTAGVV